MRRSDTTNRKGLLRAEGFTLTELLVVVSVILILMSLLVVCVDGLYTYAMRLKCQHRMEQIWHACVTYSINNDGLLPSVWDYDAGRPWYQTLTDGNYLDNPDAVLCPSSDLASVRGSGTSTTTVSTDAEAIKETVLKGLNWLEQDQTPDGTEKGYWAGKTTGLTGLALCAFLEFGYDVDDPTYGPTIEKGLKYLLDKQAGGWFEGSDPYTTEYVYYHHSIATMAVCEAYRMMGDRTFTIGAKTVSLKDAAQAAVDCILVGQHYHHGGFGYLCNPADNDTSISLWAYQALYAAKLCIEEHGADPIDIEQASGTTTQERADAFLEHNLRDEYIYGTGSSIYQFSCSVMGLPADPLRRSPERMTPGVLLIRRMFGHPPEAEDCQRQLGWLTQNLGTAENPQYRHVELATGSAGYELYAVYYQTLAFAQMGGDIWAEWADIFPEPLMNLEKDGSPLPDGRETGYWEGAIAYFSDGSNNPRAYATALACMALEVSIPGELLSSSRHYTSEPGQHSYGYNKLIANEDYRRRKPAGDTIVLMDYVRDGIDASDTEEKIAPRHGGKANVLFADGRVEALTVDELVDPTTRQIKAGMLTLEPGD